MLKVLIADDEPLILDGLTHILNWGELGLELAGLCANGAEALALLEAGEYDILITDIKMPELNGIELIRRIKQAGYNTRCIVLSSYDDFHYVKEAALLGIENYLLKPVSTVELIATLENVIEKIESDIYRQIEQNQERDILRNNVVYRWLTDDIDRKELESRASLLGIRLDEEAFRAVMIKIVYNEHNLSPYKIRDKKLLRFAAGNICGEIVSEHSRGITIADINGHLAILFPLEAGRPSAAEIRSILEQCVAKMNALLGVDVFVTVGSVQDSYRLAHASYAHARSIQDLQLIYSYNRIVFYDEIAPLLPQSEAILPRLNAERLRLGLAARDEQAVRAYLAEMSGQLRDKLHFSPSRVQYAVVELVFHMTSVMQELSHPQEPFFENNRMLFQRLYKLDTVDAIMACLTEIAIRAIAYLDKRDERISPFVRRVLGYVQRNYARNIDLKQVALEFKMTPMYLGQIVKKETGETFTNHINRLRIDKAKQLLRDTNLKTNDIAEEVGYVNANYFPTIFKKIVGMSPSEYQRAAAESKT